MSTIQLDFLEEGVRKRDREMEGWRGREGRIERGDRKRAGYEGEKGRQRI